MKSKSMFSNNDAVSISVGFILMFAVTTLMFTAMILSFYTLSQTTEKSAMRESFKIMGSALSSKITMVDTLVNITSSYGGTLNTLEYEFTMPAAVAGKTYTINITSSPHEIIVESENGARTVSPFNTSTNFTEVKLYSGAENYKLRYNKSSSSLNLEEQ